MGGFHIVVSLVTIIVRLPLVCSYICAFLFFGCIDNAAVLHNGLLGMPLAPALAGYPFGARPPGKYLKHPLIFSVHSV